MSRVVDRAKADLAAGRAWKARDRLTGALVARADDELLGLLGEVYFAMGDLPRAGAVWFGLARGRDGTDAEAAAHAWRDRHGHDDVQLWFSLPPMVRAALDRPQVESLHQVAMEALSVRRPAREAALPDAAMPDSSPGFGALLFGRRIGPDSVLRPDWPWRRGPKRGIARGVAILREPGCGRAEDVEELASSLGRQDELEGWLAERGSTLTDTPEDLSIVDSAIDGWIEHPTIGPALGNVVGLFLGSVLVRHVDGAQWHVWPNGHPVVRLGNGREYDVVALAGKRIQLGEPHLPSILAEARNRSK